MPNDFLGRPLSRRSSDRALLFTHLQELLVGTIYCLPKTLDPIVHISKVQSPKSKRSNSKFQIQNPDYQSQNPKSESSVSADESRSVFTLKCSELFFELPLQSGLLARV